MGNQIKINNFFQELLKHRFQIIRFLQIRDNIYDSKYEQLRRNFFLAEKAIKQNLDTSKPQYLYQSLEKSLSFFLNEELELNKTFVLRKSEAFLEQLQAIGQLSNKSLTDSVKIEAIEAACTIKNFARILPLNSLLRHSIENYLISSIEVAFDVNLIIY